MDQKKKSFILYLDFWNVVKMLNVEQRGILFTAIYAHEQGDELPDMDDLTMMAYTIIKTTLERDGEKYERIKANRSKAGKKGGAKSGESRRRDEAKGSKPKQNEANEADSVNDRASDSDNVNVTDTAPTVSAEMDDTDRVPRGIMDNVLLTDAEYDDITKRFMNPTKLINKVSTWLPTAKDPNQPHYPLVLRFAINDDWPTREPQEAQCFTEEDELIREAWIEYQINADRPDWLSDILRHVGEIIGYKASPDAFVEFCDAYRTIMDQQ